jgi:hypothetical protein
MGLEYVALSGGGAIGTPEGNYLTEKVALVVSSRDYDVSVWSMCWQNHSDASITVLWTVNVICVDVSMFNLVQ